MYAVEEKEGLCHAASRNVRSEGEDGGLCRAVECGESSAALLYAMRRGELDTGISASPPPTSSARRTSGRRKIPSGSMQPL